LKSDEAKDELAATKWDYHIPFSFDKNEDQLWQNQEGTKLLSYI
jgi:hypothetical protein